MPSFSDFLFGSPDKLKKVATGTKEQQGLHGDILNQLQQMLQPGGGYQQAQQYHQNILQGGQEGFNNFAQPYMQNFQEQVLPGIAERFAGGGALSSSGFGQAIGGAASGLQGQLAQLFSQLQQQSAGAQTNQFNQMSQQGLNYQPFAYQQKQGSGGFLGPLATGLGTAIGGPLGGALAGGISSLFKPQGGQSPLTSSYDNMFRMMGVPQQ